VDSAGVPTGTLVAFTVTFDVEVLFDVFESGVVETTVAVLATGPAEFGLRTTRLIVADPPLATAPSAQITALVKVHVP